MGFIQEFKNRRQLNRRIDSESRQIFSKLNQKGDLTKLELGSWKDFTDNPKAVAEEKAFKKVKKQVRQVRVKQYTDVQKQMAEKMNVKL